MSATKQTALTPEKIMSVLDTCYDKSLTGIPTLKTCFEIANEYLSKYADSDKPAEKAAKEFIRWQVAKCTTTGFITGLGGIVTIPVTLPADLVTVWYVQLRMIATLAIIGGFDPAEDTVRSLSYICMTGTSVSKFCKQAGIQIVEKTTMAAIKRIPGKALTAINQKVGFRLVTKLGSKGVINLGKLVPVVGGVVGGGLDFAETKIIATKAYDAFIKKQN